MNFQKHAIMSGFRKSGHICYYQPLSSMYIVIISKNFKALIFVDDKVPTKTGKIMSLKNGIYLLS